jgi:hypothetical protein
MKYSDTLKTSHGIEVIELFKDPVFTFGNLLGAEVKEGTGEYRVGIPVKGLFYLPFEIVFYTRRFASERKVSYIAYSPDLTRNRWGSLQIAYENKTLNINLEIEFPFEPISSLILERRIKKSLKNLEEIVRIEKIKRKI